MTIRSTKNETIITVVRAGVKGESYEQVATTAAPGGVEAKDIDTRAAGQTTTPGNAHTAENRS